MLANYSCYRNRDIIPRKLLPYALAVLLDAPARPVVPVVISATEAPSSGGVPIRSSRKRNADASSNSRPSPARMILEMVSKPSA